MFKVLVLSACIVAVYAASNQEQSEIDLSEVDWSLTTVPVKPPVFTDVPSNDIQIKIASRLLEDRVGGFDPFINLEFVRKLVSKNIGDVGEMAAGLTRVAELGKLMLREFKCTDEAYEILRDIDTATVGKRRRGLKKVEILLLEVAAEHSNHCLGKTRFWQHNYLSLKHITMHNNSRLRRQDKFCVDTLTNKIKSGVKARRFVFFDRKSKLFRDHNTKGLTNVFSLLDASESAVKDTLAALIANARDDFKYEDHMSDELLKYMFYKYLVDPCERFTEVTRPAYKHTYEDLRFQSWLDIAEDRFSDAESGWFAYHVCDLLLKKDRQQLLEKVIEQYHKEI